MIVQAYLRDLTVYQRFSFELFVLIKWKNYGIMVWNSEK